MITLQYVTTELRRAAGGQRLEHQLVQWPDEPPILVLEGTAIAAEDVSDFAGRSGHDLTAIGCLEFFVEQIRKRFSSASCS